MNDRAAVVALGSMSSEPLRSAHERWQAAAMALGVLDPVTLELVRMRCAVYHDCRRCQSVRLAPARAAGLDEVTIEAASRDYEHSGLGERHKCALRLADALMTQPGAISDGLVSQLRRHFDDDELFALTVAVMKFNNQKIDVALGIEPPVVAGRVVEFSFGPDGRPAN